MRPVIPLITTKNTKFATTEANTEPRGLFGIRGIEVVYYPDLSGQQDLEA